MRLLSLSIVLLFSASARATQHIAVIGIETCQSIGPAEAELDTIFAPSNLTAGVSNESYLPTVYLCDADLPARATAFDSVALEYASGTQAHPPWVVAYLGAEMIGPEVTSGYYWTQAVGSCGGTCTESGPLSPGFDSLPISVCETSGGLSWLGMWTEAQAAGLAMYFIVFVPGVGTDLSTTPCAAAWNLSGEWEANRVFRLIERYEE